MPARLVESYLDVADKELVDDTYKTIHTLHARTELVTGYPTGFVNLDGLIDGPSLES